jgi:hypothetical protein
MAKKEINPKNFEKYLKIDPKLDDKLPPFMMEFFIPGIRDMGRFIHPYVDVKSKTVLYSVKMFMTAIYIQSMREFKDNDGKPKYYNMSWDAIPIKIPFTDEQYYPIFKSQAWQDVVTRAKEIDLDIWQFIPLRFHDQKSKE